jgi:hypothetical protein
MDSLINLDEQVTTIREGKDDASLTRELKIVAEYKKRAEQGDLESMHQLGRYYYFCKGSGWYDQAATWYKRAAELGYAKSQNNLSFCYFNGEGVPEDNNEGFRWLVKAANEGLAMAQNRLALRLRLGNGVPENDTGAFNWFKKAAEQGDTESQAYLGLAYFQGRGVPKDDTTALQWFLKAEGKQVPRVEPIQIPSNIESESREGDAAKKTLNKISSETPIPKITALNGTIYSNVTLRSRDGNSVRISHSDGFKTLRYSELERASAELLGIEEVEKEKVAQQDLINKKRAAYEKLTSTNQEVRSFATKHLKSIVHKKLSDWSALAELERAFTVSDLKAVIGRPPDYSSESISRWRGICWNSTTEKMDDLVYTSENRSISDGRNTVYYNQRVFQCGGQSVAAPERPLPLSPETEPYILPGD